MIDEVITRITNTDLSNDPFEHKFIKEILPKKSIDVNSIKQKKDIYLVKKKKQRI